MVRYWEDKTRIDRTREPRDEQSLRTLLANCASQPWDLEPDMALLNFRFLTCEMDFVAILAVWI